MADIGSPVAAGGLGGVVSATASTNSANVRISERLKLCLVVMRDSVADATPVDKRQCIANGSSCG